MPASTLSVGVICSFDDSGLAGEEFLVGAAGAPQGQPLASFSDALSAIYEHDEQDHQPLGYLLR